MNYRVDWDGPGERDRDDLPELGLDIEALQIAEVLRRSILDIETDEPLFPDARPDLYARDIEGVIALIEKLQAWRIAARQKHPDLYGP